MMKFSSVSSSPVTFDADHVIFHHRSCQDFALFGHTNFLDSVGQQYDYFSLRNSSHKTTYPSNTMPALQIPSSSREVSPSSQKNSPHTWITLRNPKKAPVFEVRSSRRWPQSETQSRHKNLNRQTMQRCKRLRMTFLRRSSPRRRC